VIGPKLKAILETSYSREYRCCLLHAFRHIFFRWHFLSSFEMSHLLEHFKTFQGNPAEDSSWEVPSGDDLQFSRVPEMAVANS